jgi:glycosyl transferase family 25
MKYINKVFYINLDKRTDRKEALEKELSQYGIEYERFSAVYDPFGAVGCSKSHLGVIKLAKERGYKRILILEDDFSFVVSRDIFENTVEQVCENSFDVCLMAYNTIRSRPVPETYWRKVLFSYSLSCYIVNSHYYDTIISLVEPSIPLLKQTHQKEKYAIDSVLATIQERDNWYESTVRIGVQAPSYSDIENMNVNYGV